MPVPEFTEEADVVIVGSGPNGATYARLIADARPTARVLLVEAGPLVTHPPGLHMTCVDDPEERERARVASQGPNQYPYELSAASGTAHNAPREERDRSLFTRAGLFPVGSADGEGLPAAQAACAVGGMGSLWFGACPRPGDAERIGFLDPATLDDALGEAERLLGVSATQFAGSAFAAHVERVLGEALNEGRAPRRRVQPMPMAVARTPHGVRRYGADVILGDVPLGRDGGCELRPSTLCERIVMADGRAVGVRLRDRATGTVTAVRAGYVVVAGDALRTPQLLFASGIRPRALGRYLNEHSQVSLLTEVDALPPEAAAASVADSGVTWLPYEAEAYPFHGMLVRIDPDTVPHLTGDRRERKPLISVHLFTAQETLPGNRLEFSETRRDWIGMPEITIRHRLSARDREQLAYAETEVLRLGKLLGGPADGETPWVLPSGSSLHYQGTVRMGPADDGTSVCDPTCRVWGTGNLYVAGNGVIPTPTACNPTLTGVALSVIGAHDIVRRLGADAGRGGFSPARSPL